VSVYFRDLNTAQWTGVNENDTYTPASMLKVVAMMAALKLAEQNPPLLNEQLPYIASSSPFTQYYESGDNMKTGDYSVQNLIGSMIRYSDNNALDSLLSDQAINNEFSEIYGLYRLPVYSATDTTDFMSPKSYSGLFISLYNSTLFPWDLSEQVLNLLANTTFTQGLAAGVPAGTVVAHKFGENSDVQGTTVVDRELHDCGIIYAPGKPYILCVMTRGSGAGPASSSFPTLAGVIAGVSKLVYGQVTAPNTGL
jgi:beta-lactamase class A